MSAATLAEWRQAFEADEQATFFHGPLWSELWQAYTDGRYRPAPQRVELSDGRSAILGVTAERTRLGIERHHLSPAGTYGGWVSADELRPADAAALRAAILRAPSLVWRRSPDDARALPAALPGAADDATYVIDLRDGAPAAVKRWRSTARGSANHARRAGVRVREAAGRDDWLAYDALYRETLERWHGAASTVYGRSLFTLLAECGSAGVRLWLAELDGTACAGALAFAHRRRVVGWHSASSPARCAGAANLLQQEMIAAFAAEGIATYDLNPSGGHPGVVKFKESLGGEPAPAPIVVRSGVLERTAHAIRRTQRLARREARL